ncbi:hypothetical protein [Streptomyces sp. SAI-127]|uniref:hypothetical protein n=1 Tax=Streptomyces sp. SAI-127 TaxID=2940543 RepID=UPI002473B2D7|nr:hypothetical protein [Streptomyces sp. SAI-127]
MSGWLGGLRGRVGLRGTRAGCGGFLGEVGFDVRCGGPPVAFDTTRAGSASARGPWRALGAAGCGHVLGAACGVTGVDSADATPSGIATAWRTGPVGVLRFVIGDTTPRGSSAGAAAVGPKGLVTVVWRIISTDDPLPGIAAVGGSDPVTAGRRALCGTTPRSRSAVDTATRAAAVRRNAPVTVLRRIISDTTGRDRPAAVRRNGPVGVLRWRGWCRGARWG